MSGFFSSKQVSDDSEDSSINSSSEDETETSEVNEAALKEGHKNELKTILSPGEAFQEIDGPPDFLDLEGSKRRLQLDKKRKSNSSSQSQAETEKKRQCIVITAEPVTYTTPQLMSSATAVASQKEEKTESKAMDVSEFLTKGGGVMLPRKTRAQRDKEKAKREKGQSSHSKWKSEEEMLLRQQYD